MLRTLSAVALAAMIGASAAIAQDVAVVPTQTISAKTVKSVCRKLRKDDSFAEIRARLAKKKTDVFQFFKYGQCKQKLIGGGTYKVAGAYQLLLFEPKDRVPTAVAVVDYLKTKENGLQLVHAITNQQDRHGRTILDLLDLLKAQEFAKDQNQLAWLDRLRGHLCAHGALYTTPQEDCTMSEEVKQMMAEKKSS